MDLTKPFEVPAPKEKGEPDGRLKVTITFEFDVYKNSYHLDPISGEDIPPEDREKLTLEEIAKLEKGHLIEGDVELGEMMDFGEINYETDVTIEPVKED